ncbi:MAG: helix-turn-helix transcriptional regulator [Alphaproteobacteria bacterium]|nr:helix-turn-helix transcriptional regulator [Alphaproteobacteria bacterium]
MSKKSSRGRLDGEPNPVDVHVGNRVRMYRTLKGLSQEKLGEALGLTFQQVQKYEKGLNRIGASRLWDISQVLETPIGLFYEGITDETKSLSPRHLQNASLNEDWVNKVAQFTAQLDDDPLNRRETLELMRAYYRIPNRNMAHKIFDLIKAMAGPDEELESDGSDYLEEC